MAAKAYKVRRKTRSNPAVKSGDIVISSQGLLSIVSEKEFAEEFYPVKAFSEV